MELDGLTGKFHTLTDWIMTIAVANFLWIMFNLPIVYIGITMLLVQSVNEWIALGVMVVLLAPFILFPATAAMFGVIREKILHEDVKLVRSFFIHYKENYLRSMLGGLLISLMWVILVVDYYFFTEHISEMFSYFFFIIGFFLLVFTLHFFSVTVHMYTNLLGALKNSFFITLGAPLLTLGVGLFSALIIYFSFHIMTFFILFFMGSLIAYVSYLGFSKFFLKVQTLQ